MRIGDISKGSIVEIQASIDGAELSFRTLVEESKDNFAMIPVIHYEGRKVLFESDNVAYRVLYLGNSETGPYVFSNVVIKEFVNPKGKRLNLIVSNDDISEPSIRRRHQRAEIEMKGRARNDLRIGWRDVVIKDISRSGIAFTSVKDMKLDKGDNVTVQYVDRLCRMKVLVEAQVVRVKKIDNGILYGCRIYNPTAELKSYIDNKLHSQYGKVVDSKIKGEKNKKMS